MKRQGCLVENGCIGWNFSTYAYGITQLIVVWCSLLKRHWFKRDRFSRQRNKGSLGTLGFVLALIGGIVLILLSLAALLHFPVSLPFRSPLVGYFGIGAISLILGVVAVFGSKRVNEVVWAAVLMVVGFLAGGIGGLLTLLGGLVGLLSRYV